MEEPHSSHWRFHHFNDGSLKACQASQKLAIKVITSVATTTTPHASAMPPAPFSDEVSPSPLFPWHYNNPLHAASPGPSPSTSVTAPMVPYKSSCMPFISSNPAVPLPTDEVDSASSIHPLPTSSVHTTCVTAHVTSRGRASLKGTKRFDYLTRDSKHSSSPREGKLVDGGRPGKFERAQEGNLCTS
ncbi:hypothetical protein JHK84_027242 [Glycine max]|nr:hypothetical protein JHK84_027242 [Glycine max]